MQEQIGLAFLLLIYKTVEELCSNILQHSSHNWFVFDLNAFTVDILLMLGNV